MSDDLAAIIRALPAEAFRDPPARLADLGYLERLRWLEQTAWFAWKHGGAVRRGARPGPGGAGGQSGGRPGP